jgi:hypothetical protein
VAREGNILKSQSTEKEIRGNLLKEAIKTNKPDKGKK